MMNARIFAVPFVLGLVGLVGCASSSSSDNTPQQNGGLSGEGDQSALTAPDTNPKGVPYPTDNIGTSRGNRIQNYKFLGYPDGDPSKPLTPISLANYFDPTGDTVKLIHIQAAGSWCTFCQQEMTALVPLANDLASRKVVWILSLAEGPVSGKPSTKSDLDKWTAKYKAPYPAVLDPGNANLGPFYDAAALPWNANINAKTMEIISAKVGAVTTKDDLLADIDQALTKVQ